MAAIPASNELTDSVVAEQRSYHGTSNPLRNVAGCALPISAAFLALVAILLNAPTLFYMSTALIALLIACHFQARLAVRGLRFDRVVPESARIGDLVTVEIVVWSEIKIRRPLITVFDHLPGRLPLAQRTASLPIAPAFDLPVRTLYQFRALRRGRYTWSELTVEGTDALGLIIKQLDFRTASTEMVVLPRPIPVSLELPAAAGYGISENESGHTRGAGLEPFGVRDYVPGDSLRHVHWRSSAKRNKLLVKEFEAGTHASAAFVFQTTKGTDLGRGVMSSLDLMCGHAVYMSEAFLRQGMRVDFPGLEAAPSQDVGSERVAEIYDLLARIQADSNETVGQKVIDLVPNLGTGSVVFVMLCVRDEDLIQSLYTARSQSIRIVPLLYDSKVFAAKSRTATAPDFVEALRLNGALPTVVPMEGLDG